MSQILTAWIGFTDIRASKGLEKDGVGPIGQAVKSRLFDEINLISNLSTEETDHYVKWLASPAKSKIILHIVELSGSTHFSEIYESASRVVSDIQECHGKDASLTFHLSPGTPAMAAVWVILAKTRFPAELIESSLQEGVKTASVPFDISAEFIPDLLRRSDDRLERLAEGLPPKAPEFSHLIHRSSDMKRVILKAQRVAPRAVSVLIEDESGTGKEMLARAIHEASPRREKPFDSIPVYDCPEKTVTLDGFKKDYKTQTGKALNKTQLQNLGLFSQDRDQTHPTHAALLLSDSPARGAIFPMPRLSAPDSRERKNGFSWTRQP